MNISWLHRKLKGKLTYIIVCIASFLFGLLLRCIFCDMQFDRTVPLSDIAGYFITIVLALYLAHVVEKNREDKKAIISVISDMIRSLIVECEEIQHNIYNNNLNYLQAVAFPKKLSTTGKQISVIIERAHLNCKKPCKDIISHPGSLRKALTDITKPEQPFSEDSLTVSENICTIGSCRIGKIQKELDVVKKDLFNLSVDINL